jgi:hypothetical protein
MDEFKIESEEMEMLGEAMGFYVALKASAVSRHKMYKDESMDRMFQKMDNYAMAGALWTKLMKAQGIPQEKITEYLEQAKN